METPQSAHHVGSLASQGLLMRIGSYTIRIKQQGSLYQLHCWSHFHLLKTKQNKTRLLGREKLFMLPICKLHVKFLLYVNLVKPEQRNTIIAVRNSA